ncbi:DUF3152 domain-containing protein [Streptomyces sp. NPDC001941]|uniref:DUF3152 domain-containing protein n=1 Tax=Streptomyces sp. NPDC001941 TaxID=3154659 RepID=UPI003316C3E3
MGKRTAAPQGRRRGGDARRRRRQGRRAPLLRPVLLVLGVAVLCLVAGGAYGQLRGTGADGGGRVEAGNVGGPAPGASATTAAERPVMPKPRSSPPPPERGPKAAGTVPETGSGTFTTAQSSGRVVGSGPLRRYRVQVESGLDVSAEQAATEIQKILAHGRSWAAHGRGSFQLVPKGGDFVIRIATPATADKLCLAQGLDTHGELNCETADGVVVNLRRWVLGSPQYDGPPSEYRHLIINHEIGHEIGVRQHLGCPGPGRLAPVMMQQIKGLDGCRSNAWPYDNRGRYVPGPPVR